MEVLNICGDNLGDVILVVTKEKAALFDAGTPNGSAKLIENLKKCLGDRELDYIFLTHTHYDHLGGTPYIKEVYPKARVIGSAYAKKILEKQSALDAIRNMGAKDGVLPSYSDDLLKIDIVAEDLCEISDGDLKVKAIETIGHTKCSMSFLINEEVFMVNESVGYMDRSGGVHCAFLVGYDLSMASIEKCSKIPAKYLICPHCGIRKDPEVYFAQCKQIAEKTRNFVISLHNDGLPQDEICNKYLEVFYTEANKLQQPYKAFRINTEVMVKSIIKSLLDA